MLRSWEKQSKPGDWVRVEDGEGKTVGHGFFNPRSKIAVRVLAGPSAAASEPDPVIEALLRRAVSLRKEALGLERETDAFRLVNSEGDGLSGLVADRYADAIVLELFSIWPLSRLDAIDRTLGELFPGARVFLRADERIEAIEGFSVPPARRAAGKVRIREQGLSLEVDLSAHKTGAFLDQRENRLAAAALAAGRRVLDGCCYAGGFALRAALAGAAEVTGVDLDEKALETAERNARLNKLDRKVKWAHSDLFPYLRDAKRHGKTYDLLILDPPKLVAGPDVLAEGLRKYADLNRVAMEVIAPGGILVSCSCSGAVSDEAFLRMLGEAAKGAGRTLTVFRFAHAAPDHPFRLDCLESRYLKAAFARMD